jgi:hypothetical protein
METMTWKKIAHSATVYGIALFVVIAMGIYARPLQLPALLFFAFVAGLLAPMQSS